VKTMRTELLSVAAAAATVVLLLYSRRRKPVPRKAAEPSRPPSSPLSHTIQPRCLVIGVAGGSGSGKSCFTAMLKRMCENVPGCWSCLIEHDRYYKDKEQVEAECGGDWDCPVRKSFKPLQTTSTAPHYIRFPHLYSRSLQQAPNRVVPRSGRRHSTHVIFSPTFVASRPVRRSGCLIMTSVCRAVPPLERPC
jgi:hypothetical protein